MRLKPAPVVLVSVLGFLAACASTGDQGTPSPITTNVGSLDAAFGSSAQKAGVPRDLLVAIAKVEDGLELPAERPDLDVDNDVPAAGPLQLRRGRFDTLRRGAQLVNASEIELRQHADLALEAGALVLAELGAKSGARPGDLASWAEAVAEMGGYGDDLHREKYVHQVMKTLARGGTFEGRDGEKIELAPHDLPPSLTIDIDTNVRTLAPVQYPGAESFPTSCSNNKCTTTRNGAKVNFVVVHDTEGGWNASVATLQNDPGKSVQYIVDVDGKVGQFVSEETNAYHAGNFHYNQRSIGIEHVGYAAKPFAEKEYAASAKLVDHLLTKYNLPRDRAHVIGHDQIPNGNRISSSSAPCSDSPKGCQKNTSYGGASHHTDPGVWEWPTFMVRFGGTAKCNDVTKLWNCSNDKTKAFRCTNDKVEVITCNKPCEVKEVGVDDLCEAVAEAPPPTEPPAGGASEPQNAEQPEDTSGEAAALPEAIGTPQAPAAAAPDGHGAARPDKVEFGCSAGARSSSPSSVLAGLAIAALVRGVRRRRSPKPVA